MRLVEPCSSRKKLIHIFSPPLTLPLFPRHTDMFSVATILVLKKMPFTWLEYLCRYRWP